MLTRAFLLASTLIVPSLALAQPTVPGLNVATASASATGNKTEAQARAEGAQANAQSLARGNFSTAQASAHGIPTTMPPPIQRLSPSAPLNAKEKASAAAAAAWRNHPDKPARGAGGVLLWSFGTSLPSIVCSPLQVCDLALQPGEVVNSVHEGDKVRWQIKPGVSGEGGERTTHLIIKPTDAGLISSVLIFTDKRTYSIKLISTQTQWTPLTAFNYPESTDAAWENYHATMTAAAPQANTTSGGGGVDFNYAVTGNASWKPLHVYALKGKTYIQFPDTIRYQSAPALVGLANDGGWFASPSEQMLRYRITGTDTYMVDGILDHAALVSGVGSSQTKIDIRRQR